MNKTLLTLLLLAPLAVQAAEVVGKIGHMSGSLVAQRQDGSVVVLSSKSEVHAGDTLITSKEGYAQVVMNDGGQMTLRPNSNLKVESYSYNKDEPKSDNAIFSLLRGGFRAVTGLIGKRGDPDAYKIRAASSTIGVRGTDFSSRLCNNAACQEDNSKQAEATTPAVGRVMLIQGDLSAQDAQGKTRKLALGASVYEGDKLISGSKSHAVVNFRDESRITLQADTEFHVEKFKYNRVQQASEENAVLRLFKGGVRVVTGLIGRVTHDNFQFKVANSTIGVRGTGFDAWCNDACSNNMNSPGTTEDKPLSGGGVYVWAGAVVLKTPTGVVDVPVQQAAIISMQNNMPVRMQTVPPAIINNPAPAPTTVPVEQNMDSGAKEPNLYVTVHDGQVIVAKGNDALDLKRGETGFASPSELVRLPAPPAFMQTPEAAPQSNITNPNLQQGGCVVK